MSDRERRVTLKLDAEQYRQLQALATLMNLSLNEVAGGAVVFHVSKCMKAIQAREFPGVDMPEDTAGLRKEVARDSTFFDQVCSLRDREDPEVELPLMPLFGGDDGTDMSGENEE